MQRKLWEAATTGDENEIPSFSEADLQEVSPEGNSMLHIAAKRGHLKFATSLCNRHPPLLRMCNLKGDAPLHCASAAGHLEIVKLLLDRLGEMSNLSNKSGNTALHEATKAGHHRVVALLMSIEPSLADVVNGAGLSCLYMAAQRGFVEIVRILLQSPSTSHAGPRGQTALHAAVQRNFEITEMILEKMPASVKHEDATKSTPLHFAAAAGSARMVQLLLKFDASAAYMQDEQGFSSLHVAASMGHLQVIEEILAHCPDSIEQRNKQGRNLLHIAVAERILKVVNYVVKSSFLSELVDEQDNEGNTPLHLAVLSKHKKITQLVLNIGSIDPGIMNNLGNTPLDLAFSTIKTDIGLRMCSIMIYLISHGHRVSPQRIDHIRSCMRTKNDEISNLFPILANNLVIIAVLIATVTFAAAFTLPGGYKNDPGSDLGMAVLINKAAFRAFLISDSLAMASSLSIIIILIFSASLDYDVRFQSTVAALNLLWIAVCAVIVAFATGVYVVVARDCEWVALLVSTISFSFPVATWFIICCTALEFMCMAKVPICPLFGQLSIITNQLFALNLNSIITS